MSTPIPAGSNLDPETERELASAHFNSTWALLELGARSPEDDDRLVHAAHASRFHRDNVGGPAERARGEWLCSHVSALLGRAEPASDHARRCLELCALRGLGDWGVAFA